MMNFRWYPSVMQIMKITAFMGLMAVHGYGQEYDLLIKNGYLIDAKNKIADTMDVAVVQDRIAVVAKDIPAEKTKKLVDASGLIVSPGLIDIHTHVFVGNQPRTFAGGFSSVSPDDFTFRSGVTTVVDAGTSGWRNFEEFRKTVISQSHTRILAFLNIAGSGMSGSPRQEDIKDMDPLKAYELLAAYPEIMVGVKIGHYNGSDWTPFENALKAAELAGVPLFVECHLPQYTLEEQLARMRAGDIITHSFEEIDERMPIVDGEGRLRPFVREAYQRGVLFDVGHGGAGFWFSQAIPALKQGLLPHSFGTDLHRFSMNSGMKSMLNVMSKFLNMGMTLEDVIGRATWQSARSIKREDLGHLSPGAIADITLINLQKGSFGFVDSGGNSMTGKLKLETEMTVKSGRIVYDLNGLSAKPIQHQSWIEEK